MFHKFQNTVATVALILTALTQSACDPLPSLIEKITFQPSENLETIRVSLVFTPVIQSGFAIGYPVKDYGSLFINPYISQEKPFELGFALNTAVFNDQDYVKLTPTTLMPNGEPIGADYALAEVRGAHPAHPKFDIMAYVDILHANWLGVAMMFLEDKYFPAGLALSQIFKRDDQGKPTVVASVFGPRAATGSQPARLGGVGVFVNIAYLIDHHIQDETKTIVFFPEKGLQFHGPKAAEYQGDKNKINQVQQNLIERINAL